MAEEEIVNSDGKKSNFMIVVVAFILIALAGGFLFIKSNSGNKSSTIESTATATPVVSQTVDTSSQKTNTITLEAGSFYYKPNTITVKKGENVKVVINSVDMMHDFVIDELNVRTPIVKSGDTAEVTFVADTAGKYEFYCSVGSHRQKGMVGTLIIEE